MPISPTLRHRTPRALCHSVETNTDSLVKGMILFDQGGGGGRGGGKRSWSKALPPVSPLSVALFWRRIFFVVSCSRHGKNYLAGEDPPDPVIEGVDDFCTHRNLKKAFVERSLNFYVEIRSIRTRVP